MTVVNHDTGEIIEALNEADAKRLTERIRLIAENVAEQIDKLAALIDEARIGSAWLALGYRSWTAYVAGEFGGVLPRLDREPRQEFVRELAARGMSTRAIAPVVGVDQKTVARDIRRGEAHASPDQTPQGEATDDRPQQTAVEAAPVVPRPAVTGLDGKRYTAPPPKPKATEADLQAFLDSDRSIQDSRYLKELLSAMNRLGISQFDAERVGRIADDTTVMAIDHFAEMVADWHRRFTSQRTGLRVIKGGQQ